MKQTLLILIAIIPAVITGKLIYEYGVNVPYWDEWDTPGYFLIKAHEGSLTIKDLMAQHNESRMFFPKIISIGLAKLSGWNIKYEMFLSFVLACLISMNIYTLSERTLNISFHKRLFLILMTNLLIFSPMQYDNWLRGIQFVTFLPITFITLCLLVIYSETRPITQYLIFAILATISTYSIANGLLCWIIVFPLIIFRTWKNGSHIQCLFLTAITFSMFILNEVVYFYSYQKPPYHPSYLEALLNPVKSILYFFTFIGAPIAKRDQIFSPIFGLILIGIFAIVCVYSFQAFRKGKTIDSFLPWLSIGMYSIFSGLITSTGRVGFGVEQSLVSRYITFSTYLPVALIYLVVGLSEQNKKVFKFRNKTLSKIIHLILAGIVLIALVINFSYGYQGLIRESSRWLYSKACLSLINVISDSKCIEESLHPVPKRVMFVANKLSEAGMLGVKLINNPDFIKDSTIIAQDQPKNCGVFEALVDDNHGHYLATGWAILPKRQKTADAVILSYKDINGKDIAFDIAEVRERRKDIKSILNNKTYKRSGWKKIIPKEKLPSNIKNMNAWAFDVTTYEAFKLHKTQHIN